MDNTGILIRLLKEIDDRTWLVSFFVLLLTLFIVKSTLNSFTNTRTLLYIRKNIQKIVKNVLKRYLKRYREALRNVTGGYFGK
jgi:hypothetical protein